VRSSQLFANTFLMLMKGQSNFIGIQLALALGCGVQGFL